MYLMSYYDEPKENIERIINILHVTVIAINEDYLPLARENVLQVIDELVRVYSQLKG